MRQTLRACALTLFALGTLTGAPSVRAATPTPAHWKIRSAPLKPVAPGATFLVTLAADIQPGWHLYALEEPEGGPLPTVIGLAENDPLTLLDVNEPDPHKVSDPVTHAVAGMFTDNAAFTLKLRAPHSKPASDASHILVRYQTCNDQVCLPPHTETVALPLANLLR